jgi:formylglycine-generating enzyme required for sulfatase activity
VLALILAIYAYNQQREAILAQQKADDSARVAEEQRDIADINARQALEQRRLAEEKTEEARANLERAQAEESRARAALKQVKKEKNATEEQRRRAEDNYAEARKATELARAAKEEAERNLESLKQSNEAGVRALLKNAEENIESGDYVEALNKINSAYGLGVLMDEITAAFYKNIEASLKDIELNAALESLQSLHEKGLVKGAQVSDIYLRIAESSILNIYHKTALKGTRLAIKSGVFNEKVRDLLIELSYWNCEIGETAISLGLLDTAYQLSGRRLVERAGDTASLHRAMQVLDPKGYSSLQHRYYPKMVLIEGGTFRMGSPESDTLSDERERPVNSVTLSPFGISETEITVFQFALFCALTGNNIRRYLEWTNCGNHPLVNVKWYDAVEYANWISTRMDFQKVYLIDKNRRDPNNRNEYDDLKWTVTIKLDEKGYRLPTESEWEYAAGGGSTKRTRYAGTNEGKELGVYAHYSENSGGRTQVVGKKLPNNLGLCDMSGNVWEWCWDWYGDYTEGPQENPFGTLDGSVRVVRGGGWGDYSEECRVANRYWINPDYRYNFIGFRLVLVP